MKTLFTILLMLPLWLSGQCVFDTIPPGPPYPPYRDTTEAAGNPLQCYTPSCMSCDTSFTVTIFPIDGCIQLITNKEGWVGVVLMDSCNLVLKDTCYYIIPPSGVFGYICYSSPGYKNLVVCTDTATTVSVQHVPQFGTGWPGLHASVNIDSLCQSPVYIIEPIKVDTILIGSYDLQGRPWKSGPCIEVYQVGTEFYVRKFWDVYKK